MTILAGMWCSNGVVIGADSIATYGTVTTRTIEQPTRKITVVEPCLVIAGTGSVGLNQRFTAIVAEMYGNKGFSGDAVKVGTTISEKVRADFTRTGVQANQYSALVGYAANGRYQLVEFDGQLQPELKGRDGWFVSLGSGQQIVDPFLAYLRGVFWPNRPPTVKEAAFAVTWAIQHAIEVNPGGIGPPVSVATIELRNGKYEAAELRDGELGEHYQMIAECTKALGVALNGGGGSASPVEAPPTLKPLARQG